MTGFDGLLSGAVAMGYAIAGIFFLRFWTRARDGLFLGFAVAFLLLAANQALVGSYGANAETDVAFYSLRLTGFVVIIVAILRKNMGPRKPPEPHKNEKGDLLLFLIIAICIGAAMIALLHIGRAI